MFVSVYMVKEVAANGDTEYSQDSVLVDTLEEVEEAIGEVQAALNDEGRETNTELKIIKVETYNLSK